MPKSLVLLLLLAAAGPAVAQVPLPKVAGSPTRASAPETNIPESAVDEFKVEGNSISWTQSIMGASCSASAALEGSALKGELACDHGGSTVRITFLLVKQ